MKNLLIAFLFLLFNVSFSNAYATVSLGPDDFQYCADLEGPIKASTLYQVNLSDEILRKCSAGYKDIRLFAPNNKEIPHVVIENEYPNEIIETYLLEVIRYVDEKASSIIDMKLPEKYQPIRLIDLDIADRDFKKDVMLYGSHDRKTWDLIDRETIYDFSSQVDLRKTEINFKKANYRFYRIKLADTSESVYTRKSIKLKYEGMDFSVNNIQNKKLRINKIVGRTGSKANKTIIYDETNFANLPIRLDKNHNTIIIIEAALPFNRIYFDISNPYYYRSLSLYYSDTGRDDSYRLLTQDSIYSFPLSGLMETKNYVEFSMDKHKYSKFVISNRNNPLLEIKNIKFQWIQKNLYFIALNDAAKYFLCFGNNIIDKPDYDLSSFISQNNWFMQKYESLRTSPIRQNINYKPKIPIDKRTKIEKLALTIIVIVLVIGIGYWLYRLIGKTGKQE